ncbi:MAG: sigma-70 family RNA polymerase sigma factor [Candidatus Omnitrophica bacterium]|nr:sigma-70 family RNA polymerase sigma factor [Candidatus Omnitrophota bacterium]
MSEENTIINVIAAQTEIAQEKQLILKVQQGDRQAFNQLMLKYHRQVFNIAFRIFGDYHQADEIAQDVFVRVFKAIKQFEFNSRFFSWLYRITINLSRNKIKKNVKVNQRNLSLDAPYLNADDTYVSREIPDLSMAADRGILDKELNELIQCALNSLDYDFREVIILRDIQQLTYEEIGQILEINLGTVKSRLHRARGMLASILEEVM